MSLWVYNLGAAQRDGSSALSWAYSRVGDGWLLTNCSFTWGHSALPHLPVIFQQTDLSIPGKDRDAGDSKLKHAKLWSFADVVSANIPLGKASHVADPRVKEWVRFPTVRKYRMQSLLVKEGRIGSSLQSTAHLVIQHLGQFSVTRIHKQNMAWPRPENTHNSEQNGVTTYCEKDLFNQWCPREEECQFEALIYPSLFPAFKWNIPHLLVSICITLCYVPCTSQQYSGIILPAAEGEWCPASFSFLQRWWRGHMGPSNSKLSKLKCGKFLRSPWYSVGTSDYVSGRTD